MHDEQEGLAKTEQQDDWAQIGGLWTHGDDRLPTGLIELNGKFRVSLVKLEKMGDNYPDYGFVVGKAWRKEGGVAKLSGEFEHGKDDKTRFAVLENKEKKSESSPEYRISLPPKEYGEPQTDKTHDDSPF